MLGALGSLAPHIRRDILDGPLKSHMSIATFEHLDQMLA
jgi:hypothetical protein